MLLGLFGATFHKQESTMNVFQGYGALGDIGDREGGEILLTPAATGDIIGTGGTGVGLGLVMGTGSEDATEGTGEGGGMFEPAVGEANVLGELDETAEFDDETGRGPTAFSNNCICSKTSGSLFLVSSSKFSKSFLN